MGRRVLIGVAVAILSGCGSNDDDVAEQKTPLPIDQVPAAVLTEAKKAHPELDFFGASKDKYNGQDSIELKGRTKSGQIKELEMSPDGKVLGLD